MHEVKAWSPVRRVLFRFAFCYWLLYLLPVQGSASPLDILPWCAQWIQGVLFWPLQHLAVLVGARVFHLQGIGAAWHPTGSGDTALQWVLVPCMVVLAMLCTAVWSVLDRRRVEYQTLAAWLRLLLAFTLGLAMLEYGMIKVVPAQFGPPGVVALTEAYGESTPMRLLWTFMGASTGYTLLAGLGEVMGGVLLFFRRTRTLGALLSGGILFNVFLLNMFYDVPVKLYSFHLLLMVLVVVWPDVWALFGLFVLRKQVQLRTDGVPAPERKALRITAVVLRVLVFACAAWTLVWGTFGSRDTKPERSSLFGMWRVIDATSTTPQVPWARVYVSDGKALMVRRSDGTMQVLKIAADTAGAYTVTNKVLGKGLLRHTFSAEAKPRRMVLDGPLGAGVVHVALERVSPDSFLLETQGFHWVHEDSPNR